MRRFFLGDAAAEHDDEPAAAAAVLAAPAPHPPAAEASAEPGPARCAPQSLKAPGALLVKAV